MTTVIAASLSSHADDAEAPARKRHGRSICPDASHNRCLTHLPVSEGVFVYLLGLVVIAAQPERFWFGFVLAATPIVVGVLLRTYDVARGRR